MLESAFAKLLRLTVPVYLPVFFCFCLFRFTSAGLLSTGPVLFGFPFGLISGVLTPEELVRPWPLTGRFPVPLPAPLPAIFPPPRAVPFMVPLPVPLGPAAPGPFTGARPAWLVLFFPDMEEDSLLKDWTMEFFMLCAFCSAVFFCLGTRDIKPRDKLEQLHQFFFNKVLRTFPLNYSFLIALTSYLVSKTLDVNLP